LDVGPRGSRLIDRSAITLKLSKKISLTPNIRVNPYLTVETSALYSLPFSPRLLLLSLIVEISVCPNDHNGCFKPRLRENLVQSSAKFFTEGVKPERPVEGSGDAKRK
jgi:hypothetical protein